MTGNMFYNLIALLIIVLILFPGAFDCYLSSLQFRVTVTPFSKCFTDSRSLPHIFWLERFVRGLPFLEFCQYSKGTGAGQKGKDSLETFIRSLISQYGN